VQHLGVNVDSLALNLVGPSTVVADAGNDSTDVTAGHADRLAIVKRLNGSEELDILLGDVGKLEHQIGTSVGGDIHAPCSVESLAGGRDGEINILLGTLADLADNLLGGGVDDIELLLVDALDPLAVNVARAREVSVWFSGSSQLVGKGKRNSQANGLLVVTRNGSVEGDAESHDGQSVTKLGNRGVSSSGMVKKQVTEDVSKW
jgi:hypothetical protein